MLYLRSTAGRRDPGGYFQDVPGHRFIVEYQVVRLSEVNGQSILEARHPGLMPFTPLMEPPAGISDLEWTTHCAEVTRSLSVDSAVRNNLIVELWVMSGLAHERQDLLTLIPEDIMKESSVYQMIIERGIEQGVERGVERGKQLGAKAYAIERILALLNRRFNVNIASTLTPSLEAIDDLQQLSQLMDEATEVEHLENFIQVLENIETEREGYGGEMWRPRWAVSVKVSFR